MTLAVIAAAVVVTFLATRRAYRHPDPEGYRTWVELGRPFKPATSDGRWLRGWAAKLQAENGKLWGDLNEARLEVAKLRDDWWSKGAWWREENRRLRKQLAEAKRPA